MLDWKDLLKGNNLLERLKTCSGIASTLPPNPETLERIRNWQESISLDDPQFERRLALDGIDRNSLIGLFNNESIPENETEFDWFRTLAVIEKGAPTAFVYPKKYADEEQQPFWQFTHPFVVWAENEILQARDNQQSLLFQNIPISQLTVGLGYRLLEIATRTLVQEMKKARKRGRLAGETPGERFESFTKELTKPIYREELYTEYPVLGRLLSTVTRFWVDQVISLSGRLCDDRSLIADQFNQSKDPVLLISVEDIPSDPHRGGKQVWKVVFANGTGLIYKPRSIAVEGHFQELLAWLNSLRGEVDFRTLSVLDRGQYGWVEVAEKSPCENSTGFGRFYKRMGGYLALLYLLEGIDFHSGNLVAAGEHPILLDLEGLFQNPGAQPASIRWLEHSVLATGLLPIWIGRADVSALGGRVGENLETKIPIWRNAFTDEMHLEYENPPSFSDRSIPKYNGRLADPLDFQAEIEQGFESVYNLLFEHRQALSDQQGPIQAFADDETRFIPRGTRTYILILWGSHHPQALRDGLDHDRSLDRVWISAREIPYLWKLAPFERFDLWNEDIPLFSSRPNQTGLWSSTGKEISDFFPSSSLSRIKRRIALFSKEDRLLQKGYIQAALSTLKPVVTAQKNNPVRMSKLSESIQPAMVEDLVSGALEIGEELAKQAIIDQHQVNWIGFIKGQGESWGLAPMLPSLYDGTAGVALFLGYLANMVPGSGLESLAQQAHETSLAGLEEWPNAGVGAFSGLSGVLFAHMMLNRIWNQPLLDQATKRLMNRISNKIQEDEQFDVMDGTAGCALVLLELYSSTKYDQARELALACGEHLIKKMTREDGSSPWKPGQRGKGILTGFAHGAAGMATALLKLDHAFDLPAAREMADSALAFERSWFSAEAGNWADLRWDKGSQKYACAWCHGASGIGLARLLCLRFLDDPTLKEEVTIAMETIRREGFEGDHSLCHGSLGNCEIFLEAAEVLGDPLYLELARRQANLVLQEKQVEESFRSGLPIPTMAPGLMIGTAGIGLSLLHIAYPDQVPSVLGIHAAQRM